jgi:hypothetical protein
VEERSVGNSQENYIQITTAASRQDPIVEVTSAEVTSEVTSPDASHMLGISRFKRGF